MNRAVFTIIAKNYLAHARALMASVKAFDPDLTRFVILVDQPDGCFNPAAEDYTVIPIGDLPIEQPEWFRFKYTVLELSTACKPYAMRHLFERYEFDALIYLDPDILTFRSLGPVFDELHSANIAITPHLTSPISDNCRPSETDILRSGAYNLGLIAVRRSTESDRFLQWWSERLYDKCIVDKKEGLFVDQKWIDLAPGLFDGVSIVRDTTWNVAYWNLHGRYLSRSNRGYLVDGRPLLLFHFSGYDPADTERLSKYEDRFAPADLGAVNDLLKLYRSRLLANGFEQVRSWSYTWGCFADGEALSDPIRRAMRHDPTLRERVSDPFSSDGRAAIEQVWQEPAPQFSRLALSLAKSRPDVVQDCSARGKLQPGRYYAWLLTHGRSELLLAPSVVASLQAEYRRWASGAGFAERLAVAVRLATFRLTRLFR